MTYAENRAERLRKQAAECRISPIRLLLDELVDMNRSYLLTLEILEREVRDADSAGR